MINLITKNNKFVNCCCCCFAVMLSFFLCFSLIILFFFLFLSLFWSHSLDSDSIFVFTIKIFFKHEYTIATKKEEKNDEISLNDPQTPTTTTATTKLLFQIVKTTELKTKKKNYEMNTMGPFFHLLDLLFDVFSLSLSLYL